jgi:DMSO/TMAO reductase YedYZ molybdopterin-dependent catalytic subunit
MWFAAGAGAVAVALGVGELAAGLLDGSSIIVAVGALVISLQPPGGKDLMVELFGTNDKLALEIMIAVGGMLVGGLLGVVAQRERRAATAGFLVIAVAGYVLMLQDPLTTPFSAAISVVPAAIAGLWTLDLLSGLIARTESKPTAAEPVATEPAGHLTPAGAPLARRSFLAIVAVFVAAGSFLAVLGRFLGSRVASVGPPVSIPSAGETLPPVPAEADLGVAGLSPIVVPNEDFYRIDTRLTIPQLDTATWRLRVHGMVDNEVTLAYDELLAMPLYERYVTIACVSNEVGGHLVGNAKWKGVSLVSVLDSAGVQAGATQVVGRSFDGWTCGFPTQHLSGAGSEAMVAVEMNGEPLPASHGFPARLIVPGLYGYVSATKWLTEIEMTTLESFDAYWVPLGWAKQAPILTQSRIDLPRNGSSVAAGSLTVAGVAWAPTRGVSGVEVQLDDGAWSQAELSVPLSDYAWVQWRVALDVPPGAHMLSVRATDGTGETQTAERTRPAPDGARGYHQIQVNAA